MRMSLPCINRCVRALFQAPADELPVIGRLVQGPIVAPSDPAETFAAKTLPPFARPASKGKRDWCSGVNERVEAFRQGLPAHAFATVPLSLQHRGVCLRTNSFRWIFDMKAKAGIVCSLRPARCGLIGAHEIHGAGKTPDAGLG